MNLDKLEKIFEPEKPFRLKQTKQAIFRDLIENWDEATTLPLVLREQLKKEVPLIIKAEVFEDDDGQSAKALITLEDGLNVETVLMRHTLRQAQGIRSKQGQGVNVGRNTVCVSSQI